MSRYNQVNQYESDDDSSLSDDSQTQKDTQTKKRKEIESVQWGFAEKFDKPDDIAYDKCFSFLYAIETQKGRKAYYGVVKCLRNFLSAINGCLCGTMLTMRH